MFSQSQLTGKIMSDHPDREETSAGLYSEVGGVDNEDCFEISSVFGPELDPDTPTPTMLRHAFRETRLQFSKELAYMEEEYLRAANNNHGDLQQQRALRSTGRAMAAFHMEKALRYSIVAMQMSEDVPKTPTELSWVEEIDLVKDPDGYAFPNLCQEMLHVSGACLSHLLKKDLVEGDEVLSEGMEFGGEKDLEQLFEHLADTADPVPMNDKGCPTIRKVLADNDDVDMASDVFKNVGHRLQRLYGREIMDKYNQQQTKIEKEARLKRRARKIGDADADSKPAAKKPRTGKN